MSNLRIVLLSALISTSAFAWDAAFTPGIGSFVTDSTNSYTSFTQKLGVEYMLGTPNEYEIGAAVDALIVSRKTASDRSGLLIVLGPQFRGYLPSNASVFWDVLIGVAPTTGGLGESTGWALGVGAGYRFRLDSKLSLSPQLAYRGYFINGQNQSAIVLSAIFSFWNP